MCTSGSTFTHICENKPLLLNGKVPSVVYLIFGANIMVPIHHVHEVTIMKVDANFVFTSFLKNGFSSTWKGELSPNGLCPSLVAGVCRAGRLCLSIPDGALHTVAGRVAF